MTQKISCNFKILVSLFLQFFKIGAVTFGGGLAMLPVFKKDLVDSRKWVTDEEMIDYFSISQCTPGVIAVNMATFAGYKQAGVLGGIVSTIGVALPSIFIIIVIAIFISNFTEIIWVKKALKGINVAVSVLLLKAVMSLSKKTIVDIFSFLIAIFAFVLIFFFKIQGIWVILGSGSVGFVIQTVKFKTKTRKLK